MLRAIVATLLVVAVGAAPGGGVAGPTASPRAGVDAASAPRPSQLLGFANASLFRIDPQSLRPVPGNRIRVGSGGCAPRSGGTACWSTPPWAASPNGQQLAVARNDAASVRLVDVARMWVTADIRVDGGGIGALAWLAPRRILAIQEIHGEQQRLLAVDLETRRVVVRRPLGGSVQQLATTARELLMLLAPARSIGPARIAIADRRGAVRTVRLGEILAGSKLLGTGSNHSVDARLPALAVDAEGRRAFVVDGRFVAEIDLGTLTVSYRKLERRASLLSRLRSWLEPAAAAKVVSGYARDARWLGSGFLAVSGADTDASRTQSAGLLLVDTRDRGARTIDDDTTAFRVAADVLLATGARWDAAGRRVGTGLGAYGLDGGERFRLFDGEHAWVAQVFGGRAYVGVSGRPELQVVELATGRIVETRPPQLPWLLLGSGAGWWG